MIFDVALSTRVSVINDSKVLLKLNRGKSWLQLFSYIQGSLLRANLRRALLSFFFMRSLFPFPDPPSFCTLILLFTFSVRKLPSIFPTERRPSPKKVAQKTQCLYRHRSYPAGQFFCEMTKTWCKKASE